MNPFDLPPSTPPVSTAPPGDPSGTRRPGRGRIAVVAFATAGLLGAGLVGVSQLVSADRPEVGGSATPSAEPDDQPIAPPDDEQGDSDEGDTTDADQPAVDGEIVLDIGDGDPIVIDLGAGTIDGESIDSLNECIGLPDVPLFDFEIEPGDGHSEGDVPWRDRDAPFGGFEIFAHDGTHITVVGPDGVSIVDLGEDDGSVTISQEDGTVTITIQGGAVVEELSDVMGALGADAVDGLPHGRWGELDISDFFDELPQLDEMFGDFELPDRETVERCLDELRER